MEKVFIVVESRHYEGDTVMRVFAKYDDAIAYADELEENMTARAVITAPGLFSYDVLEREVY
jgi:hypothetical protein